MQGKKECIPKLMYHVSLEDLVPENNYYRVIDKELNLKFLYQATERYYGIEGQESIDPIVFFKICLVGYLNNINSDRKLIEYCSDSLAIRLFLKYDIDENLPWHSTISRTRQLYGEDIFLTLFQKVLSLCVAKGMVRGKRQAVDSAFIKANASMDSLVEKEVIEDVAVYANELNENSEYKVSAHKKKEVERHHAWKERNYKDPRFSYKEGKEGDGGDNIYPKYLSNHTHYSQTDPDAKISTKPGKPRNLNYLGQIAVDTFRHVITGAMANFADRRDSRCLKEICESTIKNLRKNQLKMKHLLTDTGYSSGETLKYCEENNIDAYIPNFGKYKPERKGFIYNKELDRYECQQGNKAILPLKNAKAKNGEHFVNRYRSSVLDCKGCSLREQCCGKKAKSKKIDDSIYKEYYDRMHKKLTDNKAYAQRMFRLRSSTVEPVLGTLINFLSMKRVNSRGLSSANKHVLMAALTYNLKKYFKFTRKKAASNKMVVPVLRQPVFLDYYGFSIFLAFLCIYFRLLKFLYQKS